MYYVLTCMDKWGKKELGRLTLIIMLFSLAMMSREENFEVAKQVDVLFSGPIASREPGAAFLVIKNSRAVFKKGYGVAELRTFRPVDSQTNFRLASLSKAFPAAAVMLPAREGKLRYDDRLSDIFPQFPAYGRTITIRHLLQHPSGLPDYEDLLPPSDRTRPIEEVQVKDAEVLAFLEKTIEAKFVPGSQWSYNNSGYVLLGLIVERKSGKPFDEFLKENIFEPLGMTKTVAYVRGINEVVNRAFGHTKKTAGGKKLTRVGPRQPWKTAVFIPPLMT
ncbi:MAG: serine hydrolase domain-containing protein [Candidatus Aminicenantales bacterium]